VSPSPAFTSTIVHTIAGRDKGGRDHEPHSDRSDGDTVSPSAGRSAVVLGASMAGLLTARVLAESHDHVTVVDRDELDGGVGIEPRRGVPQGRHAHGLLAAGSRVIEELLPGATADLVAAGVPSGDLLANVRVCVGGHRLKQVPLGVTGLAASRPYLESYVRSRVSDLANVTLRGGLDVVGLEPSAGRDRVVGARVQQRKPGSVAEVVGADLVVDATGRGSRAPRWLGELGYPAPPEETLTVDLGYTTRHYRMTPDALDGDIAIIIGPTLAHPRGGVIQVQEQDRAIVTLFGILGDHPPTDDAGFQAFAETLPLPFLADAIRGGEMLDEPVLYRFPGSTRHRYDRLRRFPAGFLVIGDALCSFNPMYGQGMSVAAIEAMTLRAEVARGLDARRFFRAVKPFIDNPWQIATGGDLIFPGVEGPRPAMVRFVNRYLARLHAAAAHDEVLSTAFVTVANLLAAPPSLLRPGIAMRVWRGGRPSVVVGPESVGPESVGQEP
jgi:2-polyprenyl-6-methoxyphenol hydroxylase-like FAD-dependent oxidoreductase